MKTKQDILDWLDEHQAEFTEISDRIWEYAETSHREFKSSKIQAEFLETAGFKITWEVCGIRTAFVAEWGNGRPILGFAGEYDALEGLSQKNQPVKEALIPGAPGHGCGHNLLGTGCMASALALRYWLEDTRTPGTVRYYGCPAEENSYAKTIMAREGIFDDLDAAFTYHPFPLTYASKGSTVAVNDIKFRFHGRAAHASAIPHLGRSALDAVELMNVGVNYLREHVTPNVRMHYVITNGGSIPNIVPAEAEVWYFLRAHSSEEMAELTARVRNIAQGAALMTGTTLEEDFRAACSSLLNNNYLSDLQFEALKLVGPIHFTEEEMDYARRINETYPKIGNDILKSQFNIPEEWLGCIAACVDQPLIGENFPALDAGVVATHSTDVGDLSRKTPLSMLYATCFAANATMHSWGIVATGAMTIGHKGMMHAAKALALAAMDCYSDPSHLQKARTEYEKATSSHPYQCPLPDHIKQPGYEMGSCESSRKI